MFAAIDADRFAKNCWVRAELGMPEIFADENDLVLPSFSFAGREEPTGQGMYSERC